MTPYSQPDAEADTANAMRAGDWELVKALIPIVDRLDIPKVSSLLGSALWYASVGLRVFPCRPLSKLPHAGSRGCLDATSDPETIRAWWDASPSSNVAIATGYGVDVLDFDGAAGHASWGAAFKEWGGFSVIASVSTPRNGGLHVYVRATGEGNHAGMVPGVDYRGLGGYVIAPPSRTETGSYRFLLKLNPEDI